MVAIHVRDVPERTVDVLKVRAARSGQSLQAYVRRLLDAEAAALTPEEAAAKARRIARRSRVTADDVVAALDEAREGRA